ncbi:Phosducin-like protein [Lachnellula occidentalis]|uniref:Phosducin-like protein n=1 Tax=Lachnellula occidentalis TaxID=215460 RepID=A0A8H8S8J9_9HELO|nr:Phosducin-like protein [Lachnellula occidentalis]
MSKTAAQEEFDTIVSKASASEKSPYHPSDADDYANDRDTSDREEQDEYTQKRINDTMRLPTFSSGPLNLPHRDFDEGRTTGVKGVIADARSYEEARRNGGKKSNMRSPNRSMSRAAEKRASTISFLKDDGEGSDSEDEEFLERWREQRKREMEREGNDIRKRRTSPSVRRFGRFDEVDALGYLDAIEKVTRETIVVVFVYDGECDVSEIVSAALMPIVSRYPSIHFVRVPYQDIEFDAAGTPAILAYKNQGDLFANLTYVVDQIPDDTVFDSKALETILRNNSVV